MRSRRSHTLDGGKVERQQTVSPTNTRCDCGKIGYTSRKAAATAASVARRETDGDPIYPYKCVRGGHVYHIGHDWPYCPVCQSRHSEGECIADTGVVPDACAS